MCLAAPTTSSGRSLLPMQPAGPRPHIPNPFQIQRLPLRIHPRPGTSPRLGANVVSLVSLLRTRPEGQDEWPSRPRPLRLHYSRGLRSPPTNRLALVCITLTAVLGTSVSPRSHHPHRPLPLALPSLPLRISRLRCPSLDDSFVTPIRSIAPSLPCRLHQPLALSLGFPLLLKPLPLLSPGRTDGDPACPSVRLSRPATPEPMSLQ